MWILWSTCLVCFSLTWLSCSTPFLCLRIRRYCIDDTSEWSRCLVDEEDGVLVVWSLLIYFGFSSVLRRNLRRFSCSRINLGTSSLVCQLDFKALRRMIECGECMFCKCLESSCFIFPHEGVDQHAASLSALPQQSPQLVASPQHALFCHLQALMMSFGITRHDGFIISSFFILFFILHSRQSSPEASDHVHS